jgi:hypothetical protein
MKTIKLRHVYDYYPLYQLMYGRDQDVKMFEAINASIAAEDFFIANHKRPLRILELFAGHSEHMPHFLQVCHAPIECYSCLDNQPHAKAHDVIVADAITGDYPGFNLILAHYFSISTAVYHERKVNGSKTFVHDRQALVTFFKNVHRNLTTKPLQGKRAFWFHLSDNGALNALLEGSSPPAINWNYGIPRGHVIRRDFHLDAFTPATLQATTHRIYDRRTSTVVDQLSNIALKSGGKILVKFTVTEPFRSRYWSETEITDVMYETGFKDLTYYANHQEADHDATHLKLPSVVEYDEDVETETLDDVSKLLATDIMGVVTK